MPGYSGDEAAPERVRRPRLTATPDPRQRPLLARGYVGFTEATTPRHLVLPATTAVPLVVKLTDPPYRPPAFVMGGHDTSIVLEGDCAPSCLEVLLSPLGAYRILGLPLDQLNGQTVDLAELLGAGGRRLGERLRDTPSWRQRFALLDRFLLRRLDRGPRPAPEVGWAWQRLAATGGTVPIGELAHEVGWSHRHLIARFRQQVGLAPRPRPGCCALTASGGIWTRAGRWTGAWSRPRPATPTRPTWSASSASSPVPPDRVPGQGAFRSRRHRGRFLA